MWVWRAIRGGGGEGRCIDGAETVKLPVVGGGGGGGGVGGGMRLLLLARGPGVRGGMEGLLCGVQTAEDSRRTTEKRAAAAAGSGWAS